MAKWRRHTEAFKRQAVERMKTAENIQLLARELKVQRKLLYTWKYQILGRPEPRRADYAITAEDRKQRQLHEEIGKLQASLSRKVVENDFLKSALLRARRERQANNEAGVSASTAQSSCGRKSKAQEPRSQSC